MSVGYELEDLCSEMKKAISGLFHVNGSDIIDRENGSYFSIFARATKRMRAILSIDREILIIGNTYLDQQARTISVAKQLISEFGNRLEPRIFIIVHRDPRGNSKLKKWGREDGVTVIPIYAASNKVPRGQELEKLLSFEFFSQDPFDVTGPVDSDAQFFGRRTEAQELARKLQQGQIRACFGIRKIGKTSIMHRVIREIEANYPCLVVFIDCQKDSVFQATAADLIMSIAITIERDNSSGGEFREVSVNHHGTSMVKSSAALESAISKVNVPLILAFDEIDYITPAGPVQENWRLGFIEFWRNIRACYQSAARKDSTLSILVCGVSSKWFSVESIDGIENAALAFVPEEYLSPMPRGATIAMIKSMGAVAGLTFSEECAEHIALTCSDMPFWVRKACSYIHGRIDANVRPLNVPLDLCKSLSTDFIREEGSSVAHVALQHLFRVYPELKQPCLDIFLQQNSRHSPVIIRALIKYGLISEASRVISGEMLRAGLSIVHEANTSTSLPELAIVERDKSQRLEFTLSDWAEELQVISRRRNILEKRIRELSVNFIKFHSLSSGDKRSAKDRIVACLAEKRRKEFTNFSVDEISEKIYWLELKIIIVKEWPVFEKVFGDRRKFEEYFDIINDRPDAHAKSIDGADVALQRKALGWIEERMASV